jgi:hypothetical protein
MDISKECFDKPWVLEAWRELVVRMDGPEYPRDRPIRPQRRWRSRPTNQAGDFAVAAVVAAMAGPWSSVTKWEKEKSQLVKNGFWPVKGNGLSRR